ncbi:MAG: DUF433 domain-containing protein [Spirulina sp.]
MAIDSILSPKPVIIRTERGLTIAGTRITLYDVMDYVVARYPAEFIRLLFDLTEAQIEAVLSYIEDNRDKVEAEYRMVLEQAEESRLYWEKRHQEHFARLKPRPSQPGREKLRAKLKAQKEKHDLEA